MGILFKQRITAASQVVSVSDSRDDILLVVDRAATIANATVPFPANPADGQMFGFSSRSAVTSLTIDTSGRAISGGITSLSAGGFANWIYDQASDRWFRIS